MRKLFILKLLSASWPLNHKPFALSCHFAGNKGCIISAIFRISRVFSYAAAAKCQGKNRKNKKKQNRAAQLSSNICVCVCPNREPGNIKPHYLQGYYLLPTGEEIAAYLLVNNNKKRHIEGKEVGEEKAGSEQRDSFIL